MEEDMKCHRPSSVGSIMLSFALVVTGCNPIHSSPDGEDDDAVDGSDDIPFEDARYNCTHYLEELIPDEVWSSANEDPPCDTWRIIAFITGDLTTRPFTFIELYSSMIGSGPFFPGVYPISDYGPHPPFECSLCALCIEIFENCNTMSDSECEKIFGAIDGYFEIIDYLPNIGGSYHFVLTDVYFVEMNEFYEVVPAGEGYCMERFEVEGVFEPY
jgi:hypothetical protein